jgi:hypothetical protein
MLPLHPSLQRDRAFKTNGQAILLARGVHPFPHSDGRTQDFRCTMLPYTLLKGAVYIHPTLAEGLWFLMEDVKPVD